MTRLSDDKQLAALTDELASGLRKFHDLPKTLSLKQTIDVRRQALERRSGVPLPALGSYSMDMTAAHCENIIGAVQVPVGVVGPVRLQGDCVDSTERLFVPLATSEGALIASIARGCRALDEAGGARVHVEDVGMTRAPVFLSTGLQQTRAFLAWIDTHWEQIRQVTESTSHYLRLLEIKPQSLCNTIYLRFRFSCGDAMGMNMVTLACDKVINELIVPATGVPCIALSGNYCTDKKPSAVNFMEGRGQRLSAEVNLSSGILAQCLKTDAETLCAVQYRKNMLGSIMAGSMGFNAQFANTIAAFFLATGQDLAHTAEGAMGITCIEPGADGGVFASVYLPDVPLGAIGGGTGLSTQREVQRLLGTRPDPARPGWAVKRLGEILATLVLAAELSLLAAMASRDLAGAHQRLGRSHDA